MSNLSDCHVVYYDPRNRLFHTRCTLGHTDACPEWQFAERHSLGNLRATPGFDWSGVSCECWVCGALEAMMPAQDPKSSWSPSHTTY
jgi:hypothetical protein